MKDKDFNLPHDENDTIKFLNCIKKRCIFETIILIN